MKHLVSRLMLLLLWLVPVGLVAGGWFLHHHGLNREWRDRVASEFRQRGIDLEIQRLTLNPFRGLVAEGVEVRNPSEPGTPLALIQHVALKIDYANLFRKQPFLEGLDLRHTDLTLPSLEGKAPIAITDLTAHVSLAANEAEVRSAQCVIEGVEVRLSGQLRNTRHVTAGNHSTGGSDPRGTISHVLEMMRELHFEGPRPVLTLKFEGDLEHGLVLDIPAASLTATKVRHGKTLLEQVRAECSLHAGLLEIRQFRVADAEGEMEASGTMDFTTGTGDLNLHSTLALQKLLRDLPAAKTLSEITVYDAPDLQASVHFDARNEPHLRATGRLAAKRFGIRSVLFDSFRTLFSWDGSRFLLEDLELKHRSGSLRCRALGVPGDFRISLESTLNPQTIAPLFGAKAIEALAEWRFEQNPKITLEARGPGPDPATLKATGTLELGRGSFRSLPYLSGTTRFRIQEKAFYYENFRIERTEGTATGNFIYDMGRREARLVGIRSTLNPVDFATWISATLVPALTPYRFHTRPSLVIDGVLKLNGPKGNRLSIGVQAPDGMNYTFLDKELQLPRVSALLLVEDTTLRIRDLQGVLLGGTIAGSADIPLDRPPREHAAEITLRNVDFEALTRLYFNYTGSKGRLSGTYQFTGKGDNPRAMVGKAQVEVVDGDVFAIPWLGPLSGLLNAIVPGLGLNVARQATATATLRDGVIHTEDFKVDAPGFTMLGGGDLLFLDDRMRFSVRINAKGLPGVLLFPVSKLFEFVSDGSMRKPQWHPKNIPLPR